MRILTQCTSIVDHLAWSYAVSTDDQRCEHPNRDEARFCSTCGRPLRCPACGARVAAGGRFCAQCGRMLGTSGEAPAVPASAEAPSGERRQITVMFCDLVGSTPLAARLDPEDFSEILEAYHVACAGAVREHEGPVAQLLGDRALAYFVHPLGARALKGIADPVALYRVERAADRRRPGGAELRASFVGRAYERQLCAERWASARDGDGQALLILGEAGIGKSRLVEQ